MPDAGSPARAAASHSYFFALRPGAADAARIYAFASALLAMRGISGRRIAPERLHVTLAWLGQELDAAALTRACNAAGSLHQAALELHFDAAMSFAAPSGPFVLLGDSGLEAVHALHAALAAALATAGFVLAQDYIPHLTLSYDPRHRAARETIEPIGFRATEFVLVKSHIGLSRHEVLLRWPLRG
ncbi:MAG TPA: 2'-5' RNA ligase family protein [Rhodocyclaceae bacterium]|nr:2'-5' RNA ligase family protein [Rhodocyclaceae bacterium]